MHTLRALLKWDFADRELVVSTSRKVMLTTAGVYLIFHFGATLVFPRTFSPSLWLVTGVVALTLIATLRLLGRVFGLAQALWFGGLAAAVLLAYSTYARPEIVLLLAFFPMMAEVMLGLRPTLIVEGLVLLLCLWWPSLPGLRPLPSGYGLALAFLSLGAGALGWSLSDNLISAIETSSYHYRQALKRLEETRQHRAEISVLLKEVSKANYQLERLNQMLSVARARAEEAREERDRFAMSVSHELRSPLNFVIGFSDLMVNSPETYAPLETWPPGLHDDIQEIYRSSNHLLSLINDILDMGKMDARQMPLFKERVDAAALIDEVCQMIVPVAEKKGLTLRVEIDPALPVLYIDRTRIRQVLINLAANALHFTEHGRIDIRARLEQPGQARFEVQDTGAGISEKDLTHIFSEFRQMSEPNWRRGEGTGLGLAIGRRFVHMHGGEMGVTSALGAGSTFFFTLPALPADEAEIFSGEWVHTRANLLEEREPLLLFLSPDLFWARTFAETLAGFKVSLLADPAQLDAVARQVFPRALIVDQALAGCPEVQAFLAAPPYDLPIITFAIPVNLNRVTALPEGIQAYLLKPVDRRRLVETVRALGAGVRALLVVDDDPGMVRFVTQSLRSAEGGEAGPPLELLTALTGAQALRLLESAAVDAVLLDLDLPDINGLALIDQMQKDERLRGVPVVVLSANDLPQSLTIEQRGLFSIAINRPLTRKELVDVLGTVLASVTPGYGSTQSQGQEREDRD